MCGSFERTEEPPALCQVCGKPAERSLVVAYYDRTPHIVKAPWPPLFERVYPLCGACRSFVVDDVSEHGHFRVSVQVEAYRLHEVKSA